MSTKPNDRIHLIENQVSIHKSRPKVQPQEPKYRDKKEKEGRREHPATRGLAPSPPSPPPGSPVTTVVISSSSGVHVAQQPTQPHAVDKRTGRYLALGVTLTMVFITLYHTFLRQVPMLAGLVPPAIIMVLYLLWIVYFAKKRKRQVQIELV